MTMKDFITLATLFIGFASFLVVINTTRNIKIKNQYTKHLPKTKRRVFDVQFDSSSITKALMENKGGISSFIENITTANGDEKDSPDVLIQDLIKTSIAGFALFVAITLLMDKMSYGLLIFIGLTVYPVVSRLLNKSQFKKDYIDGFYLFLNYMTLFLSGGVPMREALIQVNELIPESNAIKKKLNEVVSTNAISGFSGNTYVNTLEQLNEGLDYQEIRKFLNAARRTAERGDPIAETLLSQINDLSKRVNIQKRAWIANQQSKFEVLKVFFGMLTALVMFALPILISAITSLAQL